MKPLCLRSTSRERYILRLISMGTSTSFFCHFRHFHELSISVFSRLPKNHTSFFCHFRHFHEIQHLLLVAYQNRLRTVKFPKPMDGLRAKPVVALLETWMPGRNWFGCLPATRSEVRLGRQLATHRRGLQRNSWRNPVVWQLFALHSE